MRPYIEFLDCVSVYISCNGAEIWDAHSGKIICRETLSVPLSHEIVAFGKRYGWYMQTYADDCFFYNCEGVYASRYAASSRLKGILVGDLGNFIKEPRTKILMMDSDEKIAAMLEEAASLFAGRASVTCSKPYYLEFNPLLARKGVALARCSELLDIPLSEMIVFGDSLNDLSMLEPAGRSVAVSNARPEVLSSCGDICASNEEDGVAHYLESHYLKYQEVL